MKILHLHLLTAFIFLSLVEPVYAVDFHLAESAYMPAINIEPSGQTGNQPRLSEIAYRQLQPIQKLISTEQYGPALNALNQLAKRYQNKPYVISVAMKTAAYIYIAQEEYPKAALWLSRTLKLSAMSTNELQTIRHDLSQLQMHAADYINAAKTIKDWLSNAESTEIQADDYQHLAIAEFYLEHFSASKLAAQKGLALAKEPSEALYQLVLSCDLALKAYESALMTLTTLVTLYPQKKHYWQQLAGIHDVLDQSKQSLAIYELMAQQGMFTTEAEHIQYIQRLIHQNNAFKAATKLSNYIKSKAVKHNTENRLLLADAWERSGENAKALEQLKDAPIKLALVRLARIYTSEQKWENLVKVLDTQLHPTISPHNETLYLQLGYALNKLERFQDAIKVFIKIKNADNVSQDTQASAKDWLNYLTTP